jgi:hypothetical protein
MDFSPSAQKGSLFIETKLFSFLLHFVVKHFYLKHEHRYILNRLGVVLEVWGNRSLSKVHCRGSGHYA